MGLKIRDNLFYQVTPQAIYEQYARFYSNRNTLLVDNGAESYRYDLFEPNSSWTILSWDIGWEWKVRREAQLFVSQELRCPGFLVFVFDGDYWGYEFFNEGIVLDHFVTNTTSYGRWHFPDDPCVGNAQLLASYLPWLTPEDIAPYLVQEPSYDEDDNAWKLQDELDVLPRPTDEYTRFSELAVLNFYRLLGLRIQLEHHYVVPQTSKWKSFWLEPRPSD